MVGKYNTDIALFGAGIAGLWALNRLRGLGYNAVLLETDAIGGGQTVASQGIIHSGLKYAFAGQLNDLARSISAMPTVWKEALKGKDPVDLSAAQMAASSQHLLIPSGFMGGVAKLLTRKALGNSVREIDPANWPTEIKDSGFQGSVIYMDEPVLDIPSVIQALAEPYRDYIFKIESAEEALAQINAQRYIFTAAGSNHHIARAQGDDGGLKTKARPLLMGMMKNAPFPLYAHLVGKSDKPIATITTHKTQAEELVWYIGGLVAERSKEAHPQEIYEAAHKAFAKYLPDIDLSQTAWATLPIDRIEGQSKTDSWMPDTPIIHDAGKHLYCWPTKLTFAPLLSDMIIEKLKNIQPAQQITLPDWSKAEYANTPWDKAQWTKDS